MKRVLLTTAFLLMSASCWGQGINWMGFNWNYGKWGGGFNAENTNLMIDENGYLQMSISGNAPGQGAPDHSDFWVLSTDLSALRITAENRGWVSFSFKGTLGLEAGARGFADAHELTAPDVNTEFMYQGGSYHHLGEFYAGNFRFDGGAYCGGEFYGGPSRDSQEHTYRFEFNSAGCVEIYLDGVLQATTPAERTGPEFDAMFLGMNTASTNYHPDGTPSVVFTDFQVGVQSVPEPGSLSLVGLAAASWLLRRGRRGALI